MLFSCWCAPYNNPHVCSNFIEQASPPLPSLYDKPTTLMGEEFQTAETGVHVTGIVWLIY